MSKITAEHQITWQTRFTGPYWQVTERKTRIKGQKQLCSPLNRDSTVFHSIYKKRKIVIFMQKKVLKNGKLFSAKKSRYNVFCYKSWPTLSSWVNSSNQQLWNSFSSRNFNSLLLISTKRLLAAWASVHNLPANLEHLNFATISPYSLKLIPTNDQN